MMHLTKCMLVEDKFSCWTESESATRACVNRSFLIIFYLILVLAWSWLSSGYVKISIVIHLLQDRFQHYAEEY